MSREKPDLMANLADSLKAASRARTFAGSAEIVAGERVPAVGDVLCFGQHSAGLVERRKGRRVWWSAVNDVNRGLLGAERWVFLPPARRRGPERLGRRR